jgi:hypothetical protein
VLHLDQLKRRGADASLKNFDDESGRVLDSRQNKEHTDYQNNGQRQVERRMSRSGRFFRIAPKQESQQQTQWPKNISNRDVAANDNHCDLEQGVEHGVLSQVAEV